MDQPIKYYEVVAKCGHVGRKHYIPIKFAIAAINSKDAAQKIRKRPRVKHDHKDAILSVKEVDYETYLQIKKANDKDPYLKCHSRHEQSKIEDLSVRLIEDPHNKEIFHDKNERINRVSYKIKKRKNLEKSIREDYLCIL